MARYHCGDTEPFLLYLVVFCHSTIDYVRIDERHLLYLKNQWRKS